MREASSATVEKGSFELCVGDVTRHYARLSPGKCALYDGSRSVTYTELDRDAQALASALRNAGVEQGDVVCAYLPNCIDYMLVVLGVARCGAVFSPINPRYKSFEIGAILRQARPRVVFTTAAEVQAVRAAADSLGQGDVRIVAVDAACDDATPLAALLLEPPRALACVDEHAFFSLMFTSGTTGEPKGALATHRARMVWVLNASIQYGLDDNDIYLGTMPQVHSAGLTFTLMHLYAGATVRILPHFDPDEFLSVVAAEGVTSALTVPTMLTMIVEALAKSASPPSLTSLKRLVTCGAPLPLQTKRRVIEKLSSQLYDYYGSTESNSMTVLRPQDQLRKPDSVGQAFRNVELKIADAAGNACPPGVVGEVWCANPSAMLAYRDRQDETARAFTGRWFHTGDLGYLDDEGFLYLVSRLSDVVISGGVNIYPAEIEQVLMLHPDLLDAAVIGVSDSKWGQSVKAYLVAREGARLDLSAIQAHCAAHIADFKKPRMVEFVPALPKNAGGKTMKAELERNIHA